MKIKKIKLIQGGLKGATITHEKPEEKDGRYFSTDVVESKNYPIHLGLENKFKELREHFADICGFTPGSIQDDEKKYIINDVEVTGIKFENDYFILMGSKNTFADKKIGLSTHKVEEGDGFGCYDKVWKIIGELVDETKAYMDGTKKATDEEIGRRYIQAQLKKGKETISVEEFEGMTKEEQKEFCTQFLEKNGSLVQHIEDLDLGEDTQVIELNRKVG